MTRRDLLAVLTLCVIPVPFVRAQQKPQESKLQTVTLIISGMT